MVSPIMSAKNPKDKDELVLLERQHKNLVEKKSQLEEEVDLLKCESNSRSLWLKNMLEMDRGAIARIKDMQNNAEQDLKLMTGKLKLAEVEAVELSEKLKEKEIPKIYDVVGIGDIKDLKYNLIFRRISLLPEFYSVLVQNFCSIYCFSEPFEQTI